MKTVAALLLPLLSCFFFLAPYTYLVCEEFHAEGAVDDVAGRALEARVDDAHEGGAEGIVVLELHHQANVVELLVFRQPLHVLFTITNT